MSGAEVAGLVIGSASIAFQLLNASIRGFELLSDLQSLGGHSMSLQCMLQLEEHRLLAWARRSGLDNDNLDRRLDCETVRQALGQIKLLLTDAHDLTVKYGLVRCSPDTTTAAMNPLVRLTIRERSKILERNSVRKKERSFKQQVQWVIKDRKLFERLLCELRSYTDVLTETLDNMQQDAFHEDIRFLHLQIVNISDKLEEIRSMKAAIEQSTGSGSDASSCAAIKTLRMELESEAPSFDLPRGNFMSPKLTLLPPLRPRLLVDVRGNNARGMAVYDGLPVFIEWKETNPETIGIHALEMDTRIANLSTLLSTEKTSTFRSLRSIGYFEDTRMLRFCIAYNLPPHCNPNTSPISLLELFYRDSFKPSLTSRVRLALDVATTILHIHASDWLHKGIRADNILFFPSSDNSVCLKSSYLMGYEYARSDSPEERTQKPPKRPEHDIYRHPSAQGDVSLSFRRAYDVYSLGLVLMEIAKWKPLKHIMRDVLVLKKCTTEDIENLQSALLDHNNTDFLADVEFRAGSKYRSVLESCLSCFADSGGSPDVPKDRFQDLYVNNVIRVLETCDL